MLVLMKSTAVEADIDAVMARHEEFRDFEFQLSEPVAGWD